MNPLQKWAGIRGGGPTSPYVTEVYKVGAEPIGMFRAAQPGGDFSDKPEVDVTLTRLLSRGASYDADFGGGRHRRENAPTGHFEVTPAATPTTILIDDPTEIEVIYLPLDAFRSAAEAGGGGSFTGDFGRLGERGFQDRDLAELCERLWREAAMQAPYGDLLADGLTIAIVARLLQLRDGSLVDTAEGGALTPRQLSEIDAFIEEGLETRFGMEALAALCGQSRFQFSRSFKASTGRTPHAYVLERRVARARSLLEAGGLPLAEIAVACGFSSQSHMTDVFSKKLGVSPGRYRKETRS